MGEGIDPFTSGNQKPGSFFNQAQKTVYHLIYQLHLSYQRAKELA